VVTLYGFPIPNPCALKDYKGSTFLHISEILHSVDCIDVSDVECDVQETERHRMQDIPRPDHADQHIKKKVNKSTYRAFCLQPEGYDREKT
jgi:hypothetical protein